MKVYLLVEHPSWNARNHADAIAKYVPPDWDVEVSWWTGRHRVWKYDDADVIINLGSNEHKLLYRECCTRNPNAILISRYNTCYPRYEDKLRMLHECSDAVLVESRKCYQLARPRYGKIQLCPSGVDRDVFRSTVAPMSRPSKVLWCAGIVGQSPERGEVKRHRMALEIAERLKAMGVEMDVLAIDPYGDNLKSRAEMVDWYNSGRVFVCTSVMEGLPNTVLEAMACDCVVVSSPVGIVPELIQHRKSGYIVQMPTVDAFVEAICEANKQYLSHVHEVRTRIADWDWAALTGNYVQLVDEMVVSRREEVEIS